MPLSPEWDDLGDEIIGSRKNPNSVPFGTALGGARGPRDRMSIEDEAAIQLGLSPSHDWDLPMPIGTRTDRSGDRYPLLDQGLDGYERFPRWMGSSEADTAEALQPSTIDAYATRDRGLASGNSNGNRQSTTFEVGRSILAVYFGRTRIRNREFTQ